MSGGNAGVDFDPTWYDKIHINLPAVKRRAEQLGTRRTVKKQWQAAWLLRAVQCIDLTALGGDDTFTNVQRLCFKATHPVEQEVLKILKVDKPITTSAVCVYSGRVKDCAKAFSQIKSPTVPIASVATGFPAGQTPLSTRLAEIKLAIQDGASEIDVVIARSSALAGDWRTIYEEIRKMKEACGSARLKVILATGELGSLTNVYRASMVAMQAGADFIKTSTGKETVNATFAVGLVMVRAIREYYQRTSIKVGFKPAGGIKTAKDSLVWLSLMKEELDDSWTQPSLFRFGCSSLLTDIERQLEHYAYGRYAASHEIPMA